MSSISGDRIYEQAVDSGDPVEAGEYIMDLRPVKVIEKATSPIGPSGARKAKVELEQWCGIVEDDSNSVCHSPKGSDL